MMTMSMLTFVIANFCQFKDPKVPLSYKDDCLHYMANCSIIEDGKTTNKKVDECKNLWILKSETK